MLNVIDISFPQIGEEEFIDLEDEIRSAICAVPSYKSIRITSIEKV